MIPSEELEGLDQQMKTQTNFNQWTDQELNEWIEDFSSSSLLTLNNANTYIQALQELDNRKGDNVDN